MTIDTSAMNWIDLSILAIVLLSVMISLFRGFVREVMALVGWGLALWVAYSYTEVVTPQLVTYIEIQELRPIVAFAFLFISTLILAAMVNYLLGQLVDKTGLSGTDRMLGIVFGLARGCLLVALLVLLAGYTTLPQSTTWSEAVVLHYFQEMAVWLGGHLPPEFTDYGQFKKA